MLGGDQHPQLNCVLGLIAEFLFEKMQSLYPCKTRNLSRRKLFLNPRSAEGSVHPNCKENREPQYRVKDPAKKIEGKS